MQSECVKQLQNNPPPEVAQAFGEAVRALGDATTEFCK
jgi:hypothetical protein